MPERRILCDSPPLVIAGSDDRGSARPVDEWLQARNEMSIEIFLQDTYRGTHPVFPCLKALPTASSGGIEHSVASVRHPSFVDATIIVVRPSMRRVCTAARLAS